MPAGRRIRLISAAAATALAVGGAVATQASAAQPQPFTAKALTPTSTLTGAKSATGRLAKSDGALLKRTDTASVSVMVKLDYDSAAAYRGGVAGYRATSPQVTGKALNQADPDVARYLKRASDQSASASAAIRKLVPSAKVVGSYTLAYGGLAVRLPANRAKDLLRLPGVAAVQADTLQKPDAESAATGSVPNDTAAFVGATKVWPSLGGQKNAGKGVIVGVLDTGIWPEHPMLAPGTLPKPGPAGKTWGCQFGDGSDATLGAAFACNNKLVGAYAFTDTNLMVNGTIPGEFCDTSLTSVAHPYGTCSARDSDGHGTHTSTTAAGDAVDHAVLLGTDRGPISGLAPGASVIMYRVCLTNGCYSSDSVRAVQQAIVDGVNVINFSIGGGANAYTDPVELAFLDAYAAGISVSASAGNSGPGDGTAEHAGPWVTTVGALASDRAFESTLTLTSTDGTSYSKVGATVTSGVSNVPVVLATDVPGYTGTAFCLTPFAAGSLAGKAVVCERGGGGGGRVEKGYFASLGGAAGFILYNPTPSDTETDNHFLPAIHLEGPNDAMLAFLAGHAGVTASWGQGEPTRVRGDVMAGFSSRGPDGAFIKPDIAAPGVQVLAGHTPASTDLATGPTGQLYQAIAGTSMASPHSAGISALVKAAHPSWTPGQIKSALMTSAVQDVVNADGSTARPWDTGSGSIRADRAVNPTVTLDVRADDYTAGGTDPLHLVDLNVPSINADPLAGSMRVIRTIKNVSGRSQTFRTSAAADPGLKITVTPASFTLAPGAAKPLQITLDGTNLPDGYAAGQVTIRSTDWRSIDAHLPVVVNRKQGPVQLTNSCDPTALLRNQKAGCTVSATNLASEPAPATLDIVPSKRALKITDVSAPGQATSTGAHWSGTLAGSVAPTIDSIVPGSGPAGGYLPLSGFGISPVSGVGDETQSIFTVPAFKYGSETYTSVSVDSNGYLVVGGSGASTDNNCCDLTPLPNPAPPNNVIAPFWTDLNPATGGAIRVGTLTDGVDNWLVVDYDSVVAFGTTTANSFEVWIQLGDTEGQWLSYGTLGGSNGQPLEAGAENRDGTSGINITPASDTEFVITTGPPAPGGSVSYTYKASSGQAGTYQATAVLTSPLVRGTTTKAVTLTVGK